MSCYTVSKCFIENIEDKKYITDVLFVFPQQINPYKVAVDKTKRIIDIYNQCAQKNKILADWLSLMSYKPTSFEVINVNIEPEMSDEDTFLKVCSKTRSQQVLIIFSHENSIISPKYKYLSNNILNYNDISIKVIDRDQAIIELNHFNSSTINAYNSVVATDQSEINKTNLNK